MWSPDCPDFVFRVKAEFREPPIWTKTGKQANMVGSSAHPLSFPASAMSREDFATESLARYLHLSHQQVNRLAERGKIPGRKVAGQWRFSREEIHHWLEQRIGLAEDDGLPEVEGVLRGTGEGTAEQEISIADLLAPQSIGIPLAARTRNSVFSSMVELAAKTGLLWDPDQMAAAIRAREEMYPTALENGVALLHPRRPMPNILVQPLLALGISPGGIPFGGNRGGLTDIFFLICSTDDRGHLRTLARLSRILTTPGFLAELREAADAPAAHTLIRNTEAKLADV
jgi:nitrogen PTS system EIIA component